MSDPVPHGDDSTDVKDAFICHADADKPYVDGLVAALAARDFDLWYDKFVLRVGDSVASSIHEGLTSARYAIVVLSVAFFQRSWPQRELHAVMALEGYDGRRRLLPIWLNIGRDEVARHDVLLLDLFALTSNGTDQLAVARALADRLGEGVRPLPSLAQPLREKRVVGELEDARVALHGHGSEIGDVALLTWWGRWAPSVGEAKAILWGPHAKVLSSVDFAPRVEECLEAVRSTEGAERLEALSRIDGLLDEAASKVRATTAT